MPRLRTPTTARVGWFEWFAERPAWLLVLVTLLALLPFLAKPFNIDDPLFIWIARHIQSHPADPYGFSVNWYGYDWPVWDITRNPPLACYYLSLAGALFGWSEVALHGAFLLPAIAAVLGTHRLAARFCHRPILAAIVTLFSPVFLVSATTLMCDVMMLAFWVWAIVFWVEGIEQKNRAKLAAAAGLMALASLTKYFGACLLPLAAVWCLMGKRPLKQWLGWLLVPVAVLAAYQAATHALYGRGLLGDAAAYAGAIHESSLISNVRSAVSGLAFAGGCMAPAAFFVPVLWRRRELLIGSVVCLALVGVLCYIARNSFPTPLNAIELAQLIFWAIAGAGLIASALVEVVEKRDADSVMLACWLLGTFVFAAFGNWVINGRSVLPMSIPASIIVMRRLQQRAARGAVFSCKALALPAVLGGALALWVAVGDYFFALAPQTTARTVCATHKEKGHALWFQGHWGFQYYMEQGGARPLDFKKLNLNTADLKAGDYIAMPSHNTNVNPLKEPVTEQETILVPILGGLTTMDKASGSGFYASVIGPLPFAFGFPEQIVKIFTCDPGSKAN